MMPIPRRTRCIPTGSFASTRSCITAHGFLYALPIAMLLAAGTLNAQALPFLSSDADYLWPTNASRYLSATFAETRAAHYHAGVDIGTWGQQGYRVFAVRNGVVSRVVVTPTGYGNAVYLKHEDGSLSIYAHLMDFVPEIRAVVDSIRMLDYKFTFDRDLTDYDIRFNRGDILGLTGDTGIGPPHLHLELRTPSNNPFNPLLAGIRIPDRVPPSIHGLAVEPLSADATVNGTKHTLLLPVTVQKNHYTFPETRVSGTIGLAINASDRADNRRNVYAAYEVILRVNGAVAFHTRADSFAIDDAGMMRLDRIFPVLRQSRKGYQRLHLRDGNTTPFRLTPPEGGKLRLQPGRHDIEIEVLDFFRNRTLLSGTLLVSEPRPDDQPRPATAFAATRLAPDVTPGFFIDHFTWTNDWIISNTRLEHLLVRRTTLFNRLAEYYEAVPEGMLIDLRERTPVEINGVTIHRVYPGEHQIIASADGRFKATFLPTSLYDTMSVMVDHSAAGTLTTLRIHPEHEPLRGSVRLHYTLSESQRTTPGIGFYADNGWERDGTADKKFGYIGGRISGSVLTAHTGALGRFTVLSDTSAPTIASPRVFQRKDGKWFVSVLIDDDLSGVDIGRAVFIVNGQRGIAEYDPFGKRLIYYLPGFLPAKTNSVFVTVPDRAGNDAVFRAQID